MTFMRLMEDARTVIDIVCEGMECWSWKDYREVHQEWAIANKRGYLFIHKDINNTSRLNEIWGRADSNLIWVKCFKKLWASDLPTDGKTFIWQILKIGLFTGARAKTIGKGDGFCEYCLCGVESVPHTFFDCIRAKHCWNSTAQYHSKGSNAKKTLDSFSLISLIDGALIPRPREVAELFLIH